MSIENEQLGTAAERAVEAIIRDLTDRRGLRQAWESIDEDIRAEIRAEWVDLTVVAFSTGVAP